MLEPISSLSFASGIISRYTSMPHDRQGSAEMLLLRPEPAAEAQSPFAWSIQNVRLINRAITENTVYNLNIHLDFLSSILNKTVGRLHQTAARQILMLEKKAADAHSGRDQGGQGNAPAVLPHHPASVSTMIRGKIENLPSATGARPSPTVAASLEHAASPEKPRTSPGETGGRMKAERRGDAAAEALTKAGSQNGGRTSRNVERAAALPDRNTPSRGGGREFYPARAQNALLPIFSGGYVNLRYLHRELWGLGYGATSDFLGEIIPLPAREHEPGGAEGRWSENIPSPHKIHADFTRTERRVALPEGNDKATDMNSPSRESAGRRRTAARGEPVNQAGVTGERAQAIPERAQNRQITPARMESPRLDIADAPEGRKIRAEENVILPKGGEPPTRKTTKQIENLSIPQAEMVAAQLPAAAQQDRSAASAQAARTGESPLGRNLKSADNTGSLPGRIDSFIPAATLKAHTAPPRRRTDSPFPLEHAIATSPVTAAAPSSAHAGIPGKYPAVTVADTAVSFPTPPHSHAVFSHFPSRMAAALEPEYASVPRQTALPLATALRAAQTSPRPAQISQQPAQTSQHPAQTSQHPAQISQQPAQMSQRPAQISQYQAETSHPTVRSPASQPVPGAAIVYKKEARAQRHERQPPPSQTADRDIEFIKKTVKQSSVSAGTRQVNTAINMPVSGESAAADAGGAFDIDRQANAIADKVYSALERRLRSERMRKGLL